MEVTINNQGSKEQQYQEILKVLPHLVDPKISKEGNLANVIAFIHHHFKFWWTGFYWVKGDKLELGLFQGPTACTQIFMGKGVCGTAWEKKAVVIVDDVNDFPGHIACSSASLSEIVLPIVKNGEVIGVLDVDSEKKANFDVIDQIYLEKIIHEVIIPLF